MKKAFLTLFMFVLASNIFGQTSEIIVTSSYDEFELYVNNKEITEGADTIAEMKNIVPGIYILQVTFEADTIADIKKKLKVKAGKKYILKVEPKKNFAKKITKTGRKIKKTDYNDDKLTDYYYLNLVEIKDL